MDNRPITTTAPSLTTQAYQRLRTDILGGDLQPDERLRIQALSERYEIGATAIREALSRLVTEGLVDAEAQRGFTVAPVSREELIDLTETRIRVEQLALALAVQHGDLDWESRLLSSFHRLSRTPQPSSAEGGAPWAVVHRAFHETLVSGCRSDWMLRLCRLLYDKSERYRNLAIRTPAMQHGGTRAQDEHRAMLDAALARDARQLCDTLGQHLRSTTQAILDAGLGAASN